MKKKIGYICLISLTSFGCYLGLMKYNGRFSLSNIISSQHAAHFTQNELSLSEEEMLNSILSQSYRYLGRGAQIFPFVSEDGRYVIKFIKYHKGRPPFYANWPLFGSLKIKARNKTISNEKRINITLESLKIATETLRDQTAILYAHDQSTPCLHKTLKIKDRLGKTYLIALDDYEFFIQKKATLLYDQIDWYMKQGEITKAKTIISHMIELLSSRLALGIYDDDIAPCKNLGCLDDKVIFIDCGRFSLIKEDQIDYMSDLKQQTGSFCKWLEKQHPELKDHFLSHFQ